MIARDRYHPVKRSGFLQQDGPRPQALCARIAMVPALDEPGRSANVANNTYVSLRSVHRPAEFKYPPLHDIARSASALESRSDLSYGSRMPEGLVTVRSAFDPAETKARLL